MINLSGSFDTTSKKYDLHTQAPGTPFRKPESPLPAEANNEQRTLPANPSLFFHPDRIRRQPLFNNDWRPAKKRKSEPRIDKVVEQSQEVRVFN
jgi:hypothetical protein